MTVATLVPNPLADFYFKHQDCECPLVEGATDKTCRFYACHRVAWAVPTQEALDCIKRYSPKGAVEIGAGTGYWASRLARNGVNVRAFDSEPYKNRWHTGYGNVWWRVKKGSWGELRLVSKKRTLLLCWPPHANQMAEMCVEKYRGDTIAYVGEQTSRSMATDAFFDLLHERFECVEGVDLPRWPECYDDLTIWKRK